MAAAVLLLLVVSLGSNIQAAEAPQSIFAYPTQFPYGNGVAAFDVDQLSWDVKQSHSYYDRAYTNAPGGTTNLTAAERVMALWSTGTSGFYNGTPTPEHVVLDGGTIRFMGYAESPYLDYYYTTTRYSQGFESVTFTFNPRNMNFHSFSEAGFLFNGAFDSSGKYTGYALILRCSNTAGMQSGGTASLQLIYIDGQLLRDSGGNFRSGYTCELLGTYKTGIQDIRVGAAAVSFGVRLDRNVATGAFRLFVDGIEVANVSTPRTDGIGFGFYTGYYSHSCPILTVVEFNEVKLTAYVDPTPTTAEVQFLDTVSGLPIANPQTLSNVYATDKFRVTPPQTITYNDGNGEVVYQYSHSAAPTLDPIDLKADPAENVVKLYYTVKTGQVSYVDINKTANVNNGVQNNGTEAAPVKVSVGDTINYSIEVKRPDGDVGFAEGDTLTVTDILPAGLTYSGSYTVVDESNAAVDIGTVQFVTSTTANGRQQLTWKFDKLPAGRTIFKFAVQVTTAQGLYENKASFTGGGNTSTSPSTYHSAGFTVTEKYQSYYDQTTLKKDGYMQMQSGAAYSVPNTSTNDILIADGNALIQWRYYAYSTDGGATKKAGDPPQPLFLSLTADKEVILYFVKDTALTIHYLEYTDGPTNNPIKNAFNTRISSTVPYYMNVTYMDPIKANGNDYNYVGYQLPNGAYQSGPISTFPNATISSADLVAMQGGNYTINLYFVKSAGVTVRYRDLNSDNILRSPDEQYVSGIQFAGTRFNPLSHPSISDAVSQGVTVDMTGERYPYYCGYSIGDGPVILRIPPILEVTSNVTLNLYFSKNPVTIMGDSIRILYYNGNIGTEPIGDVFIDELQNGDNTLAAIVQKFGTDWLNKFRATGRGEGHLDSSTPMPEFVNGDVILYVVYSDAGQDVKTGDSAILWPFVTLPLAALLAVGAVIVKRRRTEKMNES